MFIRVYRLEIRSVMLVFWPSFVNCCPFNLLSGSTLPPPTPFPVWESLYCIHVHRYTVCKGEEVWDLAMINTCRKVSLQVNFFRWRHFALPSMSLIFLRLHPPPPMHVSRPFPWFHGNSTWTFSPLSAFFADFSALLSVSFSHQIPVKGTVQRDGSGRNEAHSIGLF